MTLLWLNVFWLSMTFLCTDFIKYTTISGAWNTLLIKKEPFSLPVACIKTAKSSSYMQLHPQFFNENHTMQLPLARIIYCNTASKMHFWHFWYQNFCLFSFVFWAFRMIAQQQQRLIELFATIPWELLIVVANLAR